MPDQPGVEEPLVPPDLPPVEPGALTWEADGTARIDATDVLVLGGDRLVWASEDGAVRSAPRDGGPATVLLQLSTVASLAARGDRIYVIGDDALWAIAPDGAVTGLVRTSGVHLAVGETDAYFWDYDIWAVPLSGGAPRTLIAGVEDLSSIAATATHVYWTDGGCEPPPFDPAGSFPGPCELRHGAVKRVPIGGGQVQSRPAFFPRALTVLDDHVYWSDAGGEAAMRAGLDGNGLEVVLAGRGATLAVDSTSTVVVTVPGLLVEVPAGGGAAWVRSAPEDAELDLAADAIYALSAGVLHRYPRGRTTIAAVATPSGRVMDLALTGEHLYYLDTHADDREDRVMRVARAGGQAEEVRAVAGALDTIAAVGDHVLTLETDAVVIALDGVPLASEVYPEALAIDAAKAYWLRGQQVFAAPLAGGPVEVVWEIPAEERSEMSSMGGRMQSSSLTRSGRYLVAAGPLLPGVVRVELSPKSKPSRKWKPRAEVLAPGSTLGAPTGDRVLAWTERGLESFPGAKLILPIAEAPDGLGALIADARDAYAITAAGLVRIPLDGAAPVVVLPNVDEGRLALDADAVYLAAPSLETILRIER